MSHFVFSFSFLFFPVSILGSYSRLSWLTSALQHM